MITKFIPKDQERGVEHVAIRNNEMRLWIPPHLVFRLRRHGAVCIDWRFFYTEQVQTAAVSIPRRDNKTRGS